ncbi:MAG: TIR domain-containing protein [Chthoniobacterales bacterium]
MIFISYRREDTKHMVLLLRDRLRKRYGDSSCFVDTQDIPLGSRWPEDLRAELSRRKILLVVIGRSWATVRFESGENEGRPRLDDKEDWVRQEICTAMRRGAEMRVVPIMVDGANLTATKWHCEIDELRQLQSFTLQDGHGFEASFIDLCKALEDAEPDLAAVVLRQEQESNARHKEQTQRSDSPALQRYVNAERSKPTTLKLPLISPSGRPVVLPIDKLRIDLPLIVSHERAPTESSSDYVWLGRDATWIHEEIRNTHTTALLIDRAADYEDIRKDCGIHERLASGSRTVILGDPGCGKSTLLEWLSHFYSSIYGEAQTGGTIADNAVQLPRTPWLPLLILCRDWTKRPVPHHFADLLRGHFDNLQFSAADIEDLIVHVEQLLDRGEVILLVDGLDEFPNPQARRDFAVFLTSLANRFPRSPIVVTSRVIGFQSVREEMTTAFDHVVVGPLNHDAKAAFLEKWGNLIGWDEAKQKEAIEGICNKRRTAKLTDTIFLLALVAQIQNDKLPVRQVDIYRRAVELMMERRRLQDEVPVTPNELLPHLEFLAFEMRKRGVQRLGEDEVITIFDALRQMELEKAGLSVRTSSELLHLCVNSLGLLNVAGMELDSQGYERPMVQFFHQSFQEYFAAKAVKHGRGYASDVGVVARLKRLLASIEINDREITLFGNRKFVEPVFADYWQETIRQCIADLEIWEADSAIEMLLPTPETPSREARPRTIFALQCLADEPKVSEEVINGVFNAVIDNLGDEDATTIENRTLMDHSLGAIGKSVLAERLQERLIEEFIRVTEAPRMRAGAAYTKICSADKSQLDADKIETKLAESKKNMESPHVPTRVATALGLVELFFLHEGKLGHLGRDHRAGFIELLMAALECDTATTAASIWALGWLTGAKIRGSGDGWPEMDEKQFTEFVLLDAAQVCLVENLIRNNRVDESFLPHAILLLTRQTGLIPVSMQRDWIYGLAVVADGGRPRRDFPEFMIFERAASYEWLTTLLESDHSQRSKSAAALALGSFGIFRPEMGEELWAVVRDSSRPLDFRDEAIIYLAWVGNAYSREMIERAARTAPDGEDDYLSTRGLFGLLLLDDVNLLAKQLRKAQSHVDLASYTYGLAGSRDPRGMERLLDFTADADPPLADALLATLLLEWMPRSEEHLALLPGFYDKITPGDLAHMWRKLAKMIGVTPVCSQHDWLHNLALVADGEQPRSKLAGFTHSDRASFYEWLIPLLNSDCSGWCKSAVALTLGSFGIFRVEMGKPLQSVIFDGSFPNELRDAATIYLGLMGGSVASQALETAADSAPVEENDCLYGRGLLGVLLLDDVDLLAKQMRKAQSHADLCAYAYGLAGTRDSRGMELLLSLVDDAEMRISEAAVKALCSEWVPESVEKYEALRKVFKRGKSPLNPKAWEAMLSFATSLRSQGKHFNAAIYFQAVLTAQIEHLGSQHEDVQRTREIMGTDKNTLLTCVAVFFALGAFFWSLWFYLNTWKATLGTIVALALLGGVVRLRQWLVRVRAEREVN